jgi:hypothetical protein
MLESSPEQRHVLVDKVPDVANIAVGALVFGQVLGEQRFSFVVAVLGASTWAGLLAWSLFLARRRRRW